MKRIRKHRASSPAEWEGIPRGEVKRARSGGALGQARPLAAQGCRAPGSVLALQRSLGNQVVGRMLASDQQGTIQRDTLQVGMGAPVQREEEGASGSDKGTITIDPTDYGTTYDVTGSTLAKAAKQMDKRKGWGYCDYDYDVNAAEVEDGIITKVDVTVSLSIVLPNWTKRDQASEASRAEWDRMLEALKTHEEGHAKIAKDGAKTVQQWVFNELEGDLEAKKKQGEAEVKTEQDEYDVKWEKGVLQGVTLTTNIDELQPEEGEEETEEELGTRRPRTSLDLGF